MLRAEPPPVAAHADRTRPSPTATTGLQSLALASLREKRIKTAELLCEAARRSRASRRPTRSELALVRLWLVALDDQGHLVPDMHEGEWWKRKGGSSRTAASSATSAVARLDEPRRSSSSDEWLPDPAADVLRADQAASSGCWPRTLALETAGDWGYCEHCRYTQRPFPGSAKCVNCGQDAVVSIDPEHRPGLPGTQGLLPRQHGARAGRSAEPPMASSRAEHTAQLNAAQSDEVFSERRSTNCSSRTSTCAPCPGERPRAAGHRRAVVHDHDGGRHRHRHAVRRRAPQHAAVARQLPAARRPAGRRGNAVATVVAFGSADSHDEHYFREPDAMIRGEVDDPIAHPRQRRDRPPPRHGLPAPALPPGPAAEIDPEEQPQLFEVLGTVRGFVGTTSPLNRTDFEAWLRRERGGAACRGRRLAAGRTRSRARRRPGRARRRHARRHRPGTRDRRATASCRKPEPGDARTTGRRGRG